ncbi:MAG: hypothetical protein IKW30_05845 [Lachnospiraceae bacterium]|nr:hypothetical protein [Lachnospiraceae bacterium]
MILTYKQCMEKYGSDYMLKKEIAEGNIFQKEKGIYSLSRTCYELEIICAKYPKAVFTGDSAFYYHNLTDVIPDYYHLATIRTDARIKDVRVKQTFIKEDIFDMGIIKMSYHNTEICIYNLERMLIELVRFRGKLPFDYYKEIIGSYRNRVDNIDFTKVEEYAARFKYSDKMMQIIELEVL